MFSLPDLILVTKQLIDCLQGVLMPHHLPQWVPIINHLTFFFLDLDEPLLVLWLILPNNFVSDHIEIDWTSQDAGVVIIQL